jgi:hypothetical protein
LHKRARPNQQQPQGKNFAPVKILTRTQDKAGATLGGDNWQNQVARRAPKKEKKPSIQHTSETETEAPTQATSVRLSKHMNAKPSFRQ